MRQGDATKAGTCGALAASPRPAAAAATQGHCLLGEGTSHLFLAKSDARVTLSRRGAVVTQQSSRNTLACSSAHMTSSSCSMRRAHSSNGAKVSSGSVSH
jgi:hypothetical protein